jgi:hypothetical protein
LPHNNDLTSRGGREGFKHLRKDIAAIIPTLARTMVIVVVVVGTIKVVTKDANVASSHDRYFEFLPVRTLRPIYLTEASSILNG